MKKSVGRGLSNLPVPKSSKGSPSASTSNLAKGRGNLAKSADDLACHVTPTIGGKPGLSPRRAHSPGGPRLGFSPVHSQAVLTGVRYMTEDMIKKAAKEENFDLITALNLNLTRGGKKIKYIENLDKLRKLHTLCLSNNIIEKMEKMEKMVRLQDLDLSHNAIVKIEGIENLVLLQTLNLSSNQIEHLPPWIGKKLKALRDINLSFNKLTSLNELSRLKALPDLTRLDVRQNMLSDLPHSHLFIIFHLTTLATLDSAHITPRDRELAQQRFAQEELERLERQLEEEEGKNKRLEEKHNLSVQARSVQEVNTQQLKVKDRELQHQLSQLQRELEAKNDLLKKKTGELNKACEKHYQLEQELAFYKIDSKFNSLSEVPHFHYNEDDESDLSKAESPYLGKALYKANKQSQESSLVVSPQKIQVHSIGSSPIMAAQKHEGMAQLHLAVDVQLDDKKKEIVKAERKLKELQSNLSATEDKLVRAAHELKKMAERKTPEPFRDDNKYKIRQRLAKKMKTVNEMRDSATQMEDEIDRRQQKIQENKGKISRLKGIAHMNRGDPILSKMSKDMSDKEQQISEDNQMYSQLKDQLADMLQNIAKETTDIKKLEQQLNEDRIEANEELRAELDDVVDGLQDYLQNVKDQSARQRDDFEQVVKEKDSLEERVRRLQCELKLTDKEANDVQEWKNCVTETEEKLHKSQDLNKNLGDQLHKSLQLNQQRQDQLEHVKMEAMNLRQRLNDAEKQVQIERKHLEKQIQLTDQEMTDKLTRQQKDGSRNLEHVRHLETQLQSLKSQNTSLREQLGDAKKTNQSLSQDTFRPYDLKKRLKDLTHNFRTGKGPIPPKGSDDVLGITFNDLHHHVQDRLNKSNKETEDARRNAQKLNDEVKTLKENLKKTEVEICKREKRDAKKIDISTSMGDGDGDVSRLEAEIGRLRQALQDAEKQGVHHTRIVYAQGSDSDDRASSLNSEEKALFDELQRELMELRRNMRRQEEDSERKVMDAENELALLTEEIQMKEADFEQELEKQRQEAELHREKQEARIQVIAEDLEQATQAAHHLQSMLNTRENQMHEDIQEANISNKVLSAQEEELSRLYDILEAQKDEIENLNKMLDQLAQQGPEGMGPGFDDDLWRIRQEVNSLKETLAMQSAYVQGMPPGTGASKMSVHTQGVGAASPLQQNFMARRQRHEASVTERRDGSGGSGGTSFPPGAAPLAAPDTLYEGQSSAPIIQSPPGPMTFQDGSSRQSGTSHLDQAPLQHSSPQQSKAASAQGIIPQDMGISIPIVGGNLGAHLSSPPRIHMLEHITNERHESKATPSRPDRQGERAQPRSPSTASKLREKDDDIFRMNRTLGQNRIKGRTKTSQPSAFEPVYRPQPHHPNSSPLPPPQLQHGVEGNVAPSNVTGMVNAHSKPIPGHSLGLFHNPESVSPSVAPAASGMPFQGFVSVPRSQYAPAGSQTDPRVTFDPNHTEYKYPAGYIHPDLPHQPPEYQPQIQDYPVQTSGYPIWSKANVTNPEVYNAGQICNPNSQPTQILSNQPNRLYYSTGSRNPVRIYYPANGMIPMTSSGTSPTPIPIQSAGIISPGPTAGAIPVTPIATGTPISNSRISTQAVFDGSYVEPPSPIRSTGMGSPVYHPRGILKTVADEISGEDESYLFCNVPEHHDLEDYIAELQEKLQKLKMKVLHYEEVHEVRVLDDESRLIHRLKSELEDRRDELEGLDLAIERQKKSLRKLKIKEKQVWVNRMSAREELDFLRTQNLKNLINSKVKKFEEEGFEESEYKNRQNYLKDELECLEKTLAKRKGHLRDADRMLKECNQDLKDAREQARDTVKRYDTASENLQSTTLEAKELEKRATDAGIKLVKIQDQLSVFNKDIRSVERKKEQKEKILQEVMQIISKKDIEFRDIDNKLRSASKSLQRVNSELKTVQLKEKETISALRDSDDVLSKKKLELSRTRDQMKTSRTELEKLDQAIGKKKEEMKLMTDSMDRRQLELSSALREAEAEITAKHREVTAKKEQCRCAEQQRVELLSVVKAKRTEVDKLKTQVEQEEEVLQRLISSVNKHKNELKHVYEMQKYEQTELENIKAQHNQKLAELEKTQSALIEEKSELEQLSTETSRKSGECERLCQTLERERQEVDHVTLEKQCLEDRIHTLIRERDMLNENCKNLDDKLNQMKRSHRIMDEKIESSCDRLEKIEGDLKQQEREMDDANHQKSLMQKDINSLKQNIKELRSELQTIEDNIHESEDHLCSLEQTLQETHSKRDDAKAEVDRLYEAIRVTRFTHEEVLQQEKLKQVDLQDLIQRFDYQEDEYQNAQKLVSSANHDLEGLRKEITSKQGKLNSLTQELEALKKEPDTVAVDRQKIGEMDKKIKTLEHELTERNDEKQELAKALTMSYEELQRLRKEATENNGNQSLEKENNWWKSHSGDEWRNEALKDKLVEEQDYLRYQLRQQMLRHAQSMESSRLRSEGTIEGLKRKLNTLQEVLFTSNNQMNSDVQAIRDMTRSTTNSPKSSLNRNRSLSPLNRNGNLDDRRIGSRLKSRSSETLIPERDLK